ncbi:hypothetical protein RRG08_054787 [Elysia crispata]|uniref:Uncharacterized protein n=1 Tax=Elysia crispata TaxID=231223 RepID=A0AAE1DX12_9GAST|nr:hypothetical protein RRG08_054787 [Elysia crispata]
MPVVHGELVASNALRLPGYLSSLYPSPTPVSRFIPVFQKIERVFPDPISVRSPEHLDESDDEGYSTIHDDAGPEVFPRVQTDKRTRPLPLPPDKQDISLRKSLPSTDATSSLEPSSMPRQNSYGAISSYPRSITVSTSADVPSIEISNTTLASITTDSSTSLTAVLVSPSKITTRKAAPGVKKSSTQASLPSPWQTNPVPHTFPYRAAQYYYLGLVNIRSGHPSLSIQSQIKLVRKIDRDMELVTMQDDLPVPENLCSGFHLIGLRNGSLCVLGLVTEVPGDDYHRYLRILKLTGDRCSHSDAPSYDTSALSPGGGENAEGTPPSNVLSAKHAIYLG